jgi:RND family efflux transporter MFP subunit
MNYETKMDMGTMPPLARGSGSDQFDLGAGEADAQLRASRRKRLIIVAAIAVVLLAIAAYVLTHGGSEEAAFAPEENAAAPAVTVISPGSATLPGIINATGTLAARREMPVGVVGEGGRVVSVPVEAGDWVRAGQVLAVIDRSVQNEQVESQAAQIEIAQADLDLAEANLSRALQLVERGFISTADVDRLTATRDAARSRVRLAQAQLRELQARNDRLNIIAPAAGLVLERNVEPGQVVGSGAGTLFSIARGGELEMLARLSEADLARLSVGARATVTPVGTTKQFTGEIWQISPIIDEDDRQGTARIALAYAPELRPGGFGSVEINSGAVVAPRLPESAIMSDDDGSYVFIVNPQNRVERRRVELGVVSDDGIAIASGLNGTEPIVARAGGFLTEGEVVRPVRQEPAAAASAPGAQGEGTAEGGTPSGTAGN